MKRIIGLFTVLVIFLSLNSAQAATKTEQMMDRMSTATQDFAYDVKDNVTDGAKATGQFLKEKSKQAGEATARHAKSGAEKAKNATVRGANKVSNSTAKGMKKAAEKMQNSADRTIEKTDKKLAETESKCKCGENCKCKKTDTEE